MTTDEWGSSGTGPFDRISLNRISKPDLWAILHPAQESKLASKKTLVPKDFSTAKQYLADRLRTMKDVSTEGFEGLLRDSLQQLTGRSFRLAKSGLQGGSDVRSVHDNTFKIALEAKRYGEKTTLKVDALAAKLGDAARQRDPAELWILAASREIDATDTEILEDKGRSEGMAVLILDWAKQAAGLPRLAALLCSTPEALRRSLGESEDLDRAIDLLRGHVEFPALSEEVVKILNSGDIGYRAARDAMAHWLEAGMSDRENAFSRLDGFNDLRGKSVKRIRRVRYDADLDAWVKSGTALALLGDEGNGKTWTFLDWWDARRVDGDLPITLFVSARTVQDRSVEELIVRLLHERLGTGTREFWSKRLENWRRATFSSPMLVLAIDGLNQYWSKRDWAAFLQPLRDEVWRGKVSILVTTWPQHWRVDLCGLLPFTPEPTTVTVGGFDDDELKRFLALHERNIDEFPRQVLPLMRVPRLTALVLDQGAAMAEIGDVTAERLAVEDWRHRLSRRGAALGVTNEEFIEFVAGIGRRLLETVQTSADGSGPGKDQFTTVELLSRLGRDSGRPAEDLRSTLHEMVAGRWLVDGTNSNTYRLSPDLVPFALGLALAEELRTTTDPDKAVSLIGEFLDPWRGQSIGVRILRAAATAALLDTKATEATRRLLVERWLDEQNFGLHDFEALSRLVGSDVDLFLALAEGQWSGERRGRGFRGDTLVDALAFASRYPLVRNALGQALVRWLGVVWSPVIDARNPASAEQVKPWLAGEKPGWPRLAWGMQAKLATSFSFSVISYCEDNSFPDALVAWALSRAALGTREGFDAAAWTLRLPRQKSGLIPRTRDAALSLLELGDPVADRAAVLLFEALGTLADDRSIPKRLDDIRMPRDDAGEAVAHPSHSLSHLDPGELWKRGSENTGFWEAIGTATEADVESVSEIIRQVLHKLDDADMDRIEQLAYDLPRLLFALDEEQRDRLRRSFTAAMDLVPEQNRAWWSARIMLLDLWAMDGDDQAAYVFRAPPEKDQYLDLRKVLVKASPEVVRGLLDSWTPEPDHPRLVSMLNYVLDTSPEAADHWRDLESLIAEGPTEPKNLILRMAKESGRPEIRRFLLDDGADYAASNDIYERYYGSMALFEAAEALGQAVPWHRMDHAILAVQVPRHPADADLLDRYWNYVVATGETLLTKRTGNVGEHYVDHDKALQVLVEARTEVVVAWLDGVLSRFSSFGPLVLHEMFPFVGLARAMMPTHPEAAIPLWRRLRDAQGAAAVKVGGLNLLPMTLPDPVKYEDVLTQLLDRYSTDHDLASLAVSAFRAGRNGWLASVVERDLSAGAYEPVARAITLAGFAMDDDRFDELWERIDLMELPREGLGASRDRARRWYARNQEARRAFADLVDGEGWIAVMSLQKLIRLVDSRSTIWMAEGFRHHPFKGERRQLWAARQDELSQAVKRSGEQLKSWLFGTKIVRPHHWPWD